jgi:hypothetical protein
LSDALRDKFAEELVDTQNETAILTVRRGRCGIQLSTTEDTEDAEEKSRFEQVEPPILRVPRGGEVILKRTLNLIR